MSTAFVTDKEREHLLSSVELTPADKVPSPPTLSGRVFMEFTVSVDTSLDSKQIYISEENSSGCSYTIGKGQDVYSAVVSAVKNYLQYETVL